MTATPTVTLTADDSQAAVVLTASGADHYLYEGSSDGTTWYTVRFNDGATAIDYEAPLVGRSYYRVTGYDASNVASTPSGPDFIDLSFDGFWLKDPFAPSLNMPLTVKYAPVKKGRALPQAVHTIRGAKYPVIVSGVRQGMTLRCELYFFTTDALRKYLALTTAPRTLLLQLDTGEQYFGHVLAGEEFSENEQGDRQGDTVQELPFQFVEVARP